MANPIQMQPGAPPPPGGGQQWMQPPQRPENCPPGLEYLAQVDQLLVKQQVELIEAFTGIETPNKYEIVNTMGQRVYYASEDACCGGLCICCGARGCCVSCAKCCSKQCCANRSMTITIKDNMGHTVMKLERPLRCASCWCPCCLQKMEVLSADHQLLGTVSQSWSLCKPQYAIENEFGDKVLTIKGPFCTANCCAGDVEFNVLDKDGEQQLGMITKQWSGFGKEMFTDADNFGCSFPMDLDVKAKATTLAAVFLIDLMFFEKSPTKKADMPGMMD